MSVLPAPRDPLKTGKHVAPKGAKFAGPTAIPHAAASSQIRTLSVERIGARLGRATPEEFTHVVEGLNEIIGL